eukprot:m.184756 g.184756  ORF g.184756 m.184756 type:complete len:60 (+) comp32206_c0_seq1:94-273(+)
MICAGACVIDVLLFVCFNFCFVDVNTYTLKIKPSKRIEITKRTYRLHTLHEKSYIKINN